MTHPSHRQEMYLFEANIVTDILDQLDDPRITPKQVTQLVINRRTITIEPSTGLWERIVGTLSGLGGSLDDDDAPGSQ